MKKFIAILTLNIYLLSLVGHFAIYKYLNYRANQFFSMQADAGRYKIDDLVEVKIPANMPAVETWGGYENVNGRIQLANASYNYVKMRITRDAIYLMCVPNYETTRLSSENVIHAEGLDNVRIPVKDHIPYGKTVVIDGINMAFDRFEFIPPFKTCTIRLVQPVINFTCHNLDIPEQPPKFLS